ncbi:MAG: O-antigen ligase family protein [Bdellovibrionota bacterium]
MFSLRFISSLFIAMVFVLPNLWSTYFNQNYVYPKRCILDFFIVLVTIALAFEKNLRLPQKRLLYFGAALLGLRIIATLFNLQWVAIYSLGDAVAFGILCVYFMTVWQKYEYSLKDFYWLIHISFFAIVGLALTQFVRSRIFDGSPNPLFYAGPFGNINMQSEYLIFLLPLTIYFMKTEEGIRKDLSHLLVTCWVFLLLAGQSRAAWIGLAGVFLYGLVFKRLSKREWATAIVTLALYMSTWWIPAEGQPYSEAKKISHTKRAEIYLGTLRMLADHPLGVGGASFEYNYMPYQMSTNMPPTEELRFDSPHSEPIKWGIEQGWLFLLVNIGFWLALLLWVWRIKAPPETQRYFRTSFFVLLPEMFFQFPFDNPASFLALSFILALMMVTGEGTNISLRRYAQVGVLVLAVLFLGKAISSTNSRWVESQLFDNPDAVKSGCELDPTSWRVCFYHGMLVLKSPYPADAMSIAKAELGRRPFDFHALRILAFAYANIPDKQRSCEIGHVYNTLFQGKSFFTQFVSEQCRDVKNPVVYEDHEQFNREYRKWLKTIL